MLYGQVGAKAVHSGQAGWIAGGPIAFPLVEVIERNAQSVKRSLRSFSEISQTSDKLVQDRLKAIQTRRPEVCGLPMDQPGIMGIVNVTPDSFSDGGLYFNTDSAVEHGYRMIEEGADIIDIGGESTRPGAQDISLETELERVLPVIKALNGRDCLVSIDTRRAGVMDMAIKSGADIVNDVSALTFDRESIEIINRHQTPVILMHCLGTPQTMQNAPTYRDVVLDIYDELENFIQKGVKSGLSMSRIIVDPGIGFGKTVQHNLDLLGNLSLFHGLGVPLLLGVSRKSFIGRISGASDPTARQPGSLAGLLVGAQQGVQLFRVHDVAPSRQALQIWSKTVTSF